MGYGCDATFGRLGRWNWHVTRLLQASLIYPSTRLREESSQRFAPFLLLLRYFATAGLIAWTRAATAISLPTLFIPNFAHLCLSFTHGSTFRITSHALVERAQSTSGTRHSREKATRWRRLRRVRLRGLRGWRVLLRVQGTQGC